jgi:RecA-family ATPase
MATASHQEPIDFAGLMPKVAELLLGQPNARLSRGQRLRFGSKGSMEIDTGEGWFDDHEANVKGGVLELIRHREGCDKAGAFRWLEAKGLKEATRFAPRGASNRTNGPDHRRQPQRAFYDYCDENGTTLFRVERRGKDAVPPFLQHGPDGNGGFHAARGCMQGVRRVLYRLPELLAADPAEIIFICEGEKDADRLADAGLIATTNPGGAGKFTADFAPALAGRRVIVLQDNDEAGANHVAAVLDVVRATAASAASLLLPGLPPKGDVSDWLANGGSAFELKRLAEKMLHKPVDTFAIADLSAWAQHEPEPKSFRMAGIIPEGEVTLFTGPGGTNKSTFGLQLCAASAAGKAMLGIAVEPGPALYVTAEDDDRENHWRLRKIAHAIGTTLDGLAGKLSVVSLRGRLNNELATFDAEGKLRPAPAFALLRATIEQAGAKLIVLDNVGHLYIGNENDRGQVTGFINLLYQLCRELGVTIVLIGHPNKAGDSYSGSTAWLNAVRSQIVLQRPEDGFDPDARILTLGKANYARPDQQLAFRWHDFALILDKDLPDDRRVEIEAIVRDNSDDDLFLRCLRERTRQRRAVSEKTGRNLAPVVFAAMPEARNVSKERLDRAMDRLFRMGRIERAELWKGDDRKPIFGLREAGVLLAVNTAGNGAETRCGNAENVSAETCRTHTSPLKGGAGAAFEGLAPATFHTDGHPDSDSWMASKMILAPGESEDDDVPGMEGFGQ